MDQFWIYFKLGFDHIIQLNHYDHLLFFMALVIPYGFSQWRRALWLVALFAIGQLTASLLSFYGVVHVNGGLIRCLLPLTVFITALFYVFAAGKKNVYESMGVQLLFSLFFGMIHGLSFASFFSATARAKSLLGLLEFSLGIEAAQLVVVFVLFVVAFILQTIFRFSKKEWILVLGSLLIGMLLPQLLNNCIFS